MGKQQSAAECCALKAQMNNTILSSSFEFRLVVLSFPPDPNWIGNDMYIDVLTKKTNS